MKFSSQKISYKLGLKIHITSTDILVIRDIGNTVSPDSLYRGLVILLGWLVPKLASNRLIVVDIDWSSAQTMCLDYPIIVYIVVV